MAKFAAAQQSFLASFAPPNIGGVSEGRGGFGALRFPHATTPSRPAYNFISFLTECIPLLISSSNPEHPLNVSTLPFPMAPP